MRSIYTGKILCQKYYMNMIWTGNLILRTMMLEYFNNSLYFKSYMSFFVQKGTKKSAENGPFLQFMGFCSALISQFLTPPPL